MISVENEIAVHAPPSRVWRALADFPRYRDLHPFIRLIGEARDGAAIEYEYTSVLRTRRKRPTPATITRFEKDVALEWRVGIRRVFEHVEGYDLARHPMGTRLKHRIEYRGAFAFAFLLARAATKAAHARICAADDALRSHLAGKKPRTAVPGEPNRPRGRKNRR